ncbi:MAG: hypothetical protein ACJ75J_05200 [Cytophagaceae bacterium]
MKKLYFFSLLAVVLCLSLSCKKEKPVLSKGFIKYFGGVDVEDASDVWQTSDGGYVIIGTTNSIGAGGSDMYVVKADANGNEEWHKTFGDVLDDQGGGVVQTLDGGYAFLGTFMHKASGADSNKTDVFLIRANSAGDTIWTKKYGYSGTNEQGVSIRQTWDGGFIIASNTDATNDGDMIVIKITAAGLLEQPLTIYPSSPTPGLDAAVNILQRNDGGYVLSSYSASLNSPRLAFINNFPISSSSNAPSKSDFFEPSMELSGEVTITNDGGYILTGKTSGDDLFVIKFNDVVTNPKIWFKTYGGPAYDMGNSIQATNDGGYIVLGSTSSFGAGSRDLYLLKINGAGDQEWYKTFGGIGLDQGKIVRRTADGGYIILGTLEFGIDPSAKDNIIALIKVDENGDIKNN